MGSCSGRYADPLPGWSERVLEAARTEAASRHALSLTASLRPPGLPQVGGFMFIVMACMSAAVRARAARRTRRAPPAGTRRTRCWFCISPAVSVAQPRFSLASQAIIGGQVYSMTQVRPLLLAQGPAGLPGRDRPAVSPSPRILP